MADGWLDSLRKEGNFGSVGGWLEKKKGIPGRWLFVRGIPNKRRSELQILEVYRKTAYLAFFLASLKGNLLLHEDPEISFTLSSLSDFNQSSSSFQQSLEVCPELCYPW